MTVLKRMFALVRLVVLLLGCAILGLFLSRFFLLPSVEERTSQVIAQQNFIRAALRAGAGQEMQRLFPEGYFFGHVLYGLTWINLALPESRKELRPVALRQARWAYARIRSAEGRAPFDPAVRPPYGVFYQGWSNLLLGGVLLLQPEEKDPVEVEEFSVNTAQLAQAFERSDGPFLPSYLQQTWPCDSFPAMLSIHVHDALFGAERIALRQDWLRAIRAAARAASGLLPHKSGRAAVRATSQTIILRFLRDLDPVWSSQQYGLFRQRFVSEKLSLPGILEFARGKTGVGDVDSGPLILGVSLSATVVALGNAHLYEDRELAAALSRAIEGFGLPLQWSGQKRYMLGVMPVGDAFAAWSASAVPWLDRPSAVPTPSSQRRYADFFSGWLFVPSLLLASVLLVLLLFLAWRSAKEVLG